MQIGERERGRGRERERIHCLLVYLFFDMFYNTVFAKWHCRNKLTGGCLNGGTCNSDSGECACVEGFEGYNCGLETGT